MDGRINNGGHSTKGYAGRKPKEDEDRIRTLSINALESIFGSEEKAFEHIAELSKDSFPHLKLLMEYAYGKPKDNKQNSTFGLVEQPIIWNEEKTYPVHKLSDSALQELSDIHAEMDEK